MDKTIRILGVIVRPCYYITYYHFEVISPYFHTSHGSIRLRSETYKTRHTHSSGWLIQCVVTQRMFWKSSCARTSVTLINHNVDKLVVSDHTHTHGLSKQAITVIQSDMAEGLESSRPGRTEGVCVRAKMLSSKYDYSKDKWPSLIHHLSKNGYSL